jgi:hypothetical protein
MKEYSGKSTLAIESSKVRRGNKNLASFNHFLKKLLLGNRTCQMENQMQNTSPGDSTSLNKHIKGNNRDSE